ncbi:MAG: hypothetical protein QXT14_02845 [Candidatus Bathyarchaeia archaeon]
MSLKCPMCGSDDEVVEKLIHHVTFYYCNRCRTLFDEDGVIEVGFVTAREWRKMETRDILTSLEVAVEELKTRDDYGNEEKLRILEIAKGLIDIAVWLERQA